MKILLSLVWCLLITNGAVNAYGQATTLTAASARRSPEQSSAGSTVRSGNTVALSLRELQTRLSDSHIDLESPLPFTEVRGVIVDATGDLVLLGIDDSSLGLVSVLPDDIVVALRVAWLSHQPAGVSIDPRPDKSTRSGIGALQDVDYFGGIEGTRVGAYAFNSDFWMKALAAGKITPPIPNFERYVDLVLAARRFDLASNRFWFYPRPTALTVSVDRDAMILDVSGVELLTEVGHALLSERTHDRYLPRDELAEQFASELTRRYQEMAAEVPDLAYLKNFFALCEVFKWVETRMLPRGLTRFTDWNYLLREYEPVQVHATPTVKTVRTSFIQGSVMLVLVGGVSAEIRLPASPTIDQSGQLASLAHNILSSRRRGSPLFWKYDGTRMDRDEVLPLVQRAISEGRDIEWMRENLPSGIGASLEELTDGAVAVLQSGSLELHRVDAEETVLLARGSEAEFQFNEIAREKCRRSSDDKLKFVHIAQEHGRIIFQVGDQSSSFTVQELSQWVDGTDVSKASIDPLFRNAEAEYVLYRDGRWVARSESGSTSEMPLSDPVFWASFLSRHYQSQIRVYLDDKISLTKKNHQRIVSLSQPSDLVALVPPDSFGVTDHGYRSNVMKILRDSEINLATSDVELVGRRNVLFISGHNDEQLFAYLTHLGERGTLAGKVIILNTCYAESNPNRLHELISRHGAVGFFHHLEKLNPVAVERALEQIDPLLREAKESGRRVHPADLLPMAVERALKIDEPSLPLQRELKRLLRGVFQISENRGACVTLKYHG